MPWTYLHSLGSYRESTVTLRDHQQHATTLSAHRAMHIAMLRRWERCILRPSQGYTGHWRADYTPPDTSSATQLRHLLQTAPEISVRKASPASARHRHAVDRDGIVAAGHDRQPGASRLERKLAHVAACHGKTRHSRLGGGGDTSAGNAEMRGGGHEVAKSAAKMRPAV